jgi:outer membrane immunogenic protein
VMRKLGLAGLALLVSAPAFAADLAVAPAPAVIAQNWTGLYLGVHAGTATQNYSSVSIVDLNGFNTSGPLPGGASLGALGGIQVGYNWQFAPAWVAGLEGDISWTSLSDQHGGAPAPSSSGIPAPGSSVTLYANTQWLASARAKLGFTGWFNTMLYVTGGAAWANTEYTAVFINIAPLNQANPTSTAIKSGWVVGGGGEWMVTSNILLRVEYLLYGIDTRNSLDAFADPIPAPLPVTSNWSRETIQVLRVAGSYKF